MFHLDERRAPKAQSQLHSILTFERRILAIFNRYDVSHQLWFLFVFSPQNALPAI